MGQPIQEPPLIVQLLTKAKLHPEGLDADELSAFNLELEKASGLEQALGIRFIHVAGDRVCAEMAIMHQHLQPMGLVHGGVYSTLAESVGSVAGIVATGRAVAGVNNNTDFLSPARAGVIEAKATAVRVGARTQLWEITMTQRNKILAVTRLRTMTLD